MWNWIRNRKALILTIVGLQDGLHELAKELHFAHGMLATFPSCPHENCVRARKIMARAREEGPYRRDINKSVNLWNDNDELREFIKQVLVQIAMIREEIPNGISPALDKLRTLVAKPPFALSWGERTREEQKKRYG